MLGPTRVTRLRFAAALLLGACARPAAPTTTTPAPPVMPDTPDTPDTPDLKEIAANEPLEAGHVAFQGMVRPTKDGYEVRGAILGDDALAKALAGAPGAGTDPEWFLGAIVRVTGVVRQHGASPASEADGVMQTRSGSWYGVERLESASVIKPAEVIQGKLERSKGFFAIAGHLVTRDDVAWSLGPQGANEGDRVRLHGQSRTVVCEPDAQCLLEGSLPMFDVGRAERLR